MTPPVMIPLCFFLCFHYNIRMTGQPLPEERLKRLLTPGEITLALAESCTGGLISHLVTSVPGSSRYFKGGVVSYSNDVKMDLLGVPGDMIQEYGAVSAPVARAMAEGVRCKLSSDIAASVTGIAGPGGGTERKPAGTAFIAFADGGDTVVRRIWVRGGRDERKSGFARAVLELVADQLK
ncbi:MAG: nicotinamide-nucleotide amidohydrolase family protein [Candidatus Omnitrophica bacterium]|nr:nicotinamide-nucleotide amidohydrolase family protein [Candidatus Omnitrophota bacterium]